MKGTNMHTTNEPHSRRRRILTWAGVVLGALLIFGFIGSLVDPVEPEPAAGASTSLEPAAPVESSAPAETPATPVPTGGDVTDQFLANQWGRQFQGVVMNVDQEISEDGLTMQLEADTNLVDPRGSNSSAPALQAVDICEALKNAFRDDWGKFFTVYVNEADGTVFATNKTPTGSGCAEY